MAMMLVLVMQLVSSSSVLAAPTARSRGENSESFSALTEWAEQHRAAGEHATSARAFAAAYEQLTEPAQGGLEGDITVNNAIDDFRLAQEHDPEDLTLLVDELALLERFGEHPARKDGLPPEIGEEIARVTERIESLQRALDAKASREKPVEEQPRSYRKRDGALLGIGIASMVGGVALTSNGAWNIQHVDRRGAELLATIAANPGGSPEMRKDLHERVESWQKRWQRLGTRFAVSGAMVTAVGIVITAWGAARLRRARLRPLAAIPWPIGSNLGVGIALVGRF